MNETLSTSLGLRREATVRFETPESGNREPGSGKRGCSQPAACSSVPASRFPLPVPTATPSIARTTSRPTIIRAIDRGVASAVLIRPTVRPARITVIVSEISITSSSLCVMRMTVSAVVAETTQHLPQLTHLRWRQHRRRLVENRGSSRRGRASSESRHAALRRPRAPRRAATGPLASPVRSLSARTSRSAALRSSERPRRSSRPRIRFSATVSVGTSMKCWCTMPTPASIASRVVQPVTSRRAPPEVATSTDAAVGRIHAREHPHERRLAGAVLADERVNLARRDLEVRAGVRDDRPESLDDARHPNRGRSAHRDHRVLTEYSAR